MRENKIIINADFLIDYLWSYDLFVIFKNDILIKLTRKFKLYNFLF